jgi:chromosome segregation ATPase
MNKKDVRDGIKDIQASLKDFKENYEEELKPLQEIRTLIEGIKAIEEEHCIELEIDWEEVDEEAVRDIISGSSWYTNIEEQIDQLLDNLGEWVSEANENKANQIEEEYIDPLTDIKNTLSIDNNNICCVDDIDNMIADLETALDDFFNN